MRLMEQASVRLAQEWSVSSRTLGTEPACLRAPQELAKPSHILCTESRCSMDSPQKRLATSRNGPFSGTPASITTDP